MWDDSVRGKDDGEGKRRDGRKAPEEGGGEERGRETLHDGKGGCNMWVKRKLQKLSVKGDWGKETGVIHYLISYYSTEVMKSRTINFL